MHLVLRDFPSSAALPAAVFNVEAGRGYCCHYRQRLEKVPHDDHLKRCMLPRPTLTAHNLILLVELYFDGARLLSHAVKGSEMTQLLRSGSIIIPAQTVWTRDVILPVHPGHGCWYGWGLEFMDVDYHDGGPPVVQVDKWSASVQLLRLTDFKTCCLLDPTTIRASEDKDYWSGRGEALGRAWTSTPDTFDAERPFERESDLIEGGMFELIQHRLPMEEGKLHPLVCSRMQEFSVGGLGYCISPSFKLPPSPRSFVYERLVEGVTVDCKDTSSLWMNKLRGKLTRRWRKLDSPVVWQAYVDAGMPAASMSVTEAARKGFKLVGQLAMSELRLSFMEVPSMNGAHASDAWFADDDDKHDDGDHMLMHMLEGLLWK